MEKAANPKMVVLARQYRGLNQSELAQKAGLKNWQISRIENGVQKLSETVLEKLSGALKFPVSFFFIDDEIVDGSRSNDLSPMGHYRKRKSAPAGVNDKIHAEINVRLDHLRRLLTNVELTGPSIPWSDIADYGMDVESLARDIRHHIGIPDGPIRNLSEYLEARQIIVVPCCLGMEIFDGYSVILRLRHRSFPLIFVNTLTPPDRVRFTIAHELGHLLLHDGYVPEKEREREANAFASEFLMPTPLISPQLSSLSIPKLEQLKFYWGTSMASILYKASQLNRISPDRERHLWKKMGYLGYRKLEPGSRDIAPETPRLLTRIIDTYRNEMQHDKTDMCTMLHLEMDEYETLYEEEMKEKPRMRIIN
ncbi:MAG: XRE family transcriptional regulator [Deltaproteobacteria bacterium]|nr:XRE family transcriptional regulator [Deltaproteobacteria bacterium]